MSGSDVLNFVRSIWKNTTLAQILLGLISILIASQGGIPWIAGGLAFSHPIWSWLFVVLGVVLIVGSIAIQFITIRERARIGHTTLNATRSNFLMAQEAMEAFKSAFESEKARRELIDNIRQEEVSQSQAELEKATGALRLKEIALKNLETITLTSLAMASVELSSSEESIKTLMTEMANTLLNLVTRIPIPPGEGVAEQALESFGEGVTQGKEPENSTLMPFF